MFPQYHIEGGETFCFCFSGVNLWDIPCTCTHETQHESAECLLPVSQFTVRIAHGDIYVRMQIPAGVSFILADRRLRREFPYLVKPCKVSTKTRRTHARGWENISGKTRTNRYVQANHREGLSQGLMADGSACFVCPSVMYMVSCLLIARESSPREISWTDRRWCTRCNYGLFRYKSTAL